MGPTYSEQLHSERLYMEHTERIKQRDKIIAYCDRVLLLIWVEKRPYELRIIIRDILQILSGKWINFPEEIRRPINEYVESTPSRPNLLPIDKTQTRKFSKYLIEIKEILKSYHNTVPVIIAKSQKKAIAIVKS